MSIFPKRTIAGSTVTIHWNISLPAQMQQPVCPYVRIGIIDPAGTIYMLLEEHILLLPAAAAAPAPAAPQKKNTRKYLEKHTPLLILASYLAGQQPREKLAEILTNIRNGRHYYFTWPIPHGAPPGKYTLLSEMFIDGACKHSGTAADDFFYVEQLDITEAGDNTLMIHNPGPEPVPIKLISFMAEEHSNPEALNICHLQPGSNCTIDTTGKSLFLVYNEERITVPLHTRHQPRALRNQQHQALYKEEAGEPVSYILPREGDSAYRLTGMQQALWKAANGMNSAAHLREKDAALYDEMITHRLITEIP